ncbi:DNA-binding transcriptional regulator, MerR family [Paenibacillus sp. 1_12]|uniref:MerR family transcriptional regulator n=1 Tax=Paenibacillus sp. 1_12 TaxID=1566278 RepID=UPI0008E96284|nr:MerR family transcriptional regulator [Paenibacillus sp. 1_12]SFL54536.1 DNA-binding transcriptional regulator, MerR family [Paenibacillus sp. 1_12]
MYSIKKASELLGIPTVTIRAWENRYQIINPIRGNGGHRLYSDADIDTLKWIKTQIDENKMKVSEAVWLLKQRSLKKPIKAVERTQVGKPYDDLIERLFGHLVDLNTFQSHEIIDLAFALYHYDDVFHHILVPVLYQMGEEWERGNVTVAQEHFSSQLVMQRITQFFRVLPIHPDLPKVLALCPEGEHHHMGLMLFSLFLRKKGVDVIYLGPNTPLSDLKLVIEQKQISVVAVSVTDHGLIEALEHWIDECRVKYPNLKFVLGGTGFQHCLSHISTYVQPDDQNSWEMWYKMDIMGAKPSFV